VVFVVKIVEYFTNYKYNGLGHGINQNDEYPYNGWADSIYTYFHGLRYPDFQILFKEQNCIHKRYSDLEAWFLL
jgi:hypothetical protein